MITIEHLKKEYESVTPLQDVNAEIEKGEIISIIGPSGTGKSTLLRCINLLESPTSGSIFIDGQEITAKDCKLNELRMKMGMVFQSFNLFEHMNVLENIIYAPMKLHGLSREEAEKKAMELLKTVSLSEKAYNYPSELSGGQKQRIAIARTLAMDPEIILFDEPTSALDPTMVGEVLSVIRMLAEKGMTMMIVTHEMRFARNVSSRVFYMDEGVIYEDGTPDQIFDHPQKEKTRQFIRQLKILEADIPTEGFDSLGFHSQLELFGRHHLMPQYGIYASQVVLDELCMQTVLPKLHAGESLHFVLEYSEKLDTASVTLEYGGESFDAAEHMAELPKVLFDHAVSEYEHQFKDGKNTLTVQLKLQK